MVYTKTVNLSLKRINARLIHQNPTPLSSIRRYCVSTLAKSYYYMDRRMWPLWRFKSRFQVESEGYEKLSLYDLCDNSYSLDEIYVKSMDK